MHEPFITPTLPFRDERCTTLQLLENARMTILETIAALDALDLHIFLQVNGQPSAPHWLFVPAYFLATQLIYLLPVGLAGSWCWGTERERQLVLHVLFAVLVLLLLNQAIGLAWPRPRPFMLGVGHTFFSHTPTPSFPSNHAGIVWTCGLVLASGIRSRVLGWLTLVAGAGVAWARVFLGVHFPLDMIGAMVTALLAWRLTAFVWPGLNGVLYGLCLRAYHSVFAYPIAWKWVRD